jgi:SAM-dependent methyltransferase
MNQQHSHACRSCAKTGLVPILNLGYTPLANALLTAEQLEQAEEKFPLELFLCPKCTLVQIAQTVSPEKLFREYFYLSSFSNTMLCHAASLAREMIEARQLHAGSLVVEVASNDGYLLQYYQKAGVPVLGIEPAENIARIARGERGINTISEFFGIELAGDLAAAGQRADVIHAHNVLAHVADLDGFVRGLNLLLKDNGIAVIEVPYVKEMIDNTEFDTIYHEHLCYFSLTALNHLFRRHRLETENVKRLPLHGGTLRISARKAQRDKVSNESTVRGSNVEELMREEAGWAGDPDFYRGFGERVARLRVELVDLLNRLKSEGKRIAVYGASAKGSTLLNYFGIGRELLDFVVDRSIIKQGYYTPGTHLAIHAPEKLLQEMPDYVLLLTWNFADEILEQQIQYRQRGGRFIIPIPELKIV